MSYSPSASFTFDSGVSYTPSPSFIFDNSTILSTYTGYYGGTSSESLTIYPLNVFNNFNGYYGNSSSYSLSTTVPLYFSGYYGSESSETLSIEVHFNFDGYYGDLSTVDLTIYNVPRTPFVFNNTYPFFYQQDFVFGTGVLRPYRSYYGNTSTFSLALGELLSFNGYYGNESVYTLSLLSFIDLGTINSYYGESVSADLYLPPPITFDFASYRGNVSHFNINLSYNIFLNFSGYYGRESNFVWQDQKFTIDLDLDSCCFSGGKRPVFGESWNIELDNAEWYDQTYHNKSRIKTSFDLSTRARFHFEAFYGNTNQIIDPLIYLGNVSTGQFFTGHYGRTCYFEFEANNKHKLCKGNFIPDSENIFVELTEIVSEDCAATFSYYGNTAFTTISTNSRFTENAYYGNVATFDLTIYPNVIPPEPVYIAHRGNSLIFEDLKTQYNLSFESYYGNTAHGMSFKEIEYKAGYGSTSSFTLVELVGVEIVDSGDLENEYRYLNQDGDEIKSLFTKSVVELYPYQHWIKARCIKM